MVPFRVNIAEDIDTSVDIFTWIGCLIVAFFPVKWMYIFIKILQQNMLWFPSVKKTRKLGVVAPAIWVTDDGQSLHWPTFLNTIKAVDNCTPLDKTGKWKKIPILRLKLTGSK